MYHPFKKVHVYPVQIAKDNTPEEIRATHPTAKEFEAGGANILDPTQFKLINHGQLALYETDPFEKKKKTKIINYSKSVQCAPRLFYVHLFRM